MTLLETTCEFAKTYAQRAGLSYAVAQDKGFVFMIFWNAKYYMNSGLSELGNIGLTYKGAQEITAALDNYWARMEGGK